jgi:TRAP transporter 4TM/12TM fusion protein
MTTGAFTIPTMKKMGYQPVQAASIEAAASTGGQFTPPIMAAAGFILASFIGVPYIKVAAMAAVPAVLYFFGVGAGVHFLARKHSLLAIPRDKLPSLKRVIRTQGILVAPIIVVTILLVEGFSPMKSAIYATIPIVLISLFYKERRIGVVRAFRILERSGRSVLQLIATCSCAGVILSALLSSGLGYKMPWIIKEVAGDNLLFALALGGSACIILGMGMTTTAAYIIGATLVAPAIVDLGVPEVAVHLFVLWFGISGCVTPPFALSAYAGATLAGAPVWKTCIASFRLAYPIILIPLIFVYNRALLLDGPIFSILYAVLAVMLGLISISVGIHGYGYGKIPSLDRMLFILAGTLLLHVPWMTGLFGMLLMGILVFLDYRRKQIA